MGDENNKNTGPHANQSLDASHVLHESSESAHETRDQRDESFHLLSIDEVARRTELSKPTLRFYEQRGLVEPPPRPPGKFRKYSPQDLERLESVKRLRDLLGLSLSEIEETLRIDKEHARLVELARAQWDEMNDTTLLRTQLDEARHLNQQESEEVEKQLDAVEEKIEGLERLRVEIIARKQRIDELESRIKQIERERELDKTR
jgi:DNA-binding transcriptional MerR regulator